MKESMRRHILGLIIVLSVFSITIQSSKNSFLIFSYAFAENQNEAFDHSHLIYDSLLKKYVLNARVDYKGFVASEKELDKYLKQVGSVSESDYANWSYEQKLAFWINAYNAFTIKAIIDNYPIEKHLGLKSLFYPKNSIRQIDGVWDKLKFQAVGKMVTLNQIEHEILRKQFKEPRIHVAIVCASISCPNLRNEAYTGDKINAQLETQAIEFVNNPTKGVQINIVDKSVNLSKIFGWFGEDFIERYGTSEFFKNRKAKERAVLNFARKYLKSEKERKFLENNQFSISYLHYDWSLNEIKENKS